MDAQEQAEGEKRVQAVLIDGLLRRGLVKPGHVTAAQFADMLEGLRAKLAYMTAENLAALEEAVAAMPAGKARDRFPIANVILDQAAQIQPPGDDASPLIRAVFAHELGLSAIAEGWAPELLREVRKVRKWPGPYQVRSIREAAQDALRRMALLDERLAYGGELTGEDADWRRRRLAALDRCRSIRALAAGAAA